MKITHLGYVITHINKIIVKDKFKTNEFYLFRNSLLVKKRKPIGHLFENSHTFNEQPFKINLLLNIATSPAFMRVYLFFHFLLCIFL